jgi:hypothetical protein
MNISGLSPSRSPYSSTATQLMGGRAGAAEGKPTPEANKPGELSAEDAARIAKLKQIDRQVRQHEQAHLAAAGGMATSGASYTYQKGPDGVNYAVGGEVSISVSPGRTPEETLRRAQTVRAAALAPADPSGQDRAVAAQATKMAMEARMEMAQQTGEKVAADDPQGSSRQSEVADFYNSSPKTPGRAISTYA